MTPFTSKYQPLRLEDFAGLAKVKAILGKVAANPYQSAWLFAGDPGTGKTTMAYAFAAKIGAQVHHVAAKACNLEAVDAVCYACSYVPMFGANAWHVVIVDEIDQATTSAQVAFLSKLDSTEFPPQTIFIFTTNDVTRLEARFVSRCRTLTFEAVEPSLAVRVLSYVWSKETTAPMSEAVLKHLVRESNGNLRDALNNLELEVLAI